MTSCSTIAICFLVGNWLIAATHEVAPGVLEELLAKQAKMEEHQHEMEEHQHELERKIQFLERVPATERRLELESISEEKIAAAEAALEQVDDPEVKTVLQYLVQSVGNLRVALDYLWLLVAGALVMFMQAGFALVEAGSCRRLNCGLVLTKNMVDACMGAAVWWAVGYGLAYGTDGTDEPNEYIGTSHFFGREFTMTDSHHRDWFFQWAFCATAATIVSGAVAERIKFVAYAIYAVLMTALIYPAIVYWTWSGEGFLTKMGYSDFAGSGIVHLTGGTGAFVAAAVLGPRYGRWKESNAAAFVPHDLAMVVQGTLILWFGWYGFNCGSTLGFSNLATAWTASLVAMNTTLAAAFGGLTVLAVRFFQTQHLDLAGTCNGLLAGLVAACAGCDSMSPWGAIVCGVAGGLANLGFHQVLEKLRIDDPLDASAVHGGGGLCGVLLRPLLDRSGVQLGMLRAHVVASFCIVAWSGGITFLIMVVLKKMGMLTASREEQKIGGDEEELIVSAYSHDRQISLESESALSGDDDDDE